MRGLPFPTTAISDREPSYDHGTPFSNGDAIPIDPALAGTPEIDPAITGDKDVGVGATEQVPPEIILDPILHQPLRQYSQEPRQYDLGPQGDPFAPHPPAPYLPIQEEEVTPAPKPPKKKRRPRREPECGFCQGNDLKNKAEEPEVMVSCDDCGRSGWHMYCLQPPLEEEPPGQWHCPMCPPIELSMTGSAQRENSVVSNSLVPHHPTKADTKGKGKAPAPSDVEVDDDDDDSDDSDSDSDSDSDDSTVNKVTPVRPPKKRKNKRPTRKTDQTPRPIKRMRIRVRSPVAPPIMVRLRIPPKGKGKEREDESERMFDDMLTPAERDMSKTGIESGDRLRFEKSRLNAEEKLAPPPPPSTVMEVPETPIAGPSSRPLRSTALHQLSLPPGPPTPSPAPSTPSAFPSTPGAVPATSIVFPPPPNSLRIRTIRFGHFDIHPWYDAPFPEEYANIPDGRLWICEYCLKYMRSGFAFGRHRMKCKARHPPGDEIYRDGTVSIFEVDGRKNKIYCQNLCLLSKMFLDHKSLFYDVEPFLFYVMAETDDIGAHFVGYFSKEKCSPKYYNVSCIMTLPVRQRQGWGNFLIDFSYLLSKKEQRSGSPEKPLSGLGALGYKNYWTLALMRYLRTAPANPRLEDISKHTSMTIEDICSTLTHQNMISILAATPPPVRPTPGQSIKFPRGRRNGIARKHLQRTNTQNKDEEGKASTPFTPPAKYNIHWDREKVEHYLEAWEKKGYLKLRPERLKWTPFVLARTKDNGQVLQTAGCAVVGVGASSGQAKTPEIPSKDELPVNSTAQTPIPGDTGPSNVDSLATGEMDAMMASAARLFDDTIPDDPESPLPKKLLRSRLKQGTRAPSTVSNREETAIALSSPLPHTRSTSARLMPELNGTTIAADDESGPPPLPELVITPSVPVKRRRGRPPRPKPPEVAPPIEPSLLDLTKEAPSRSGSKSYSPRKRRRVGTPEGGAHDVVHDTTDTPQEPPLEPNEPDGLMHPQNGHSMAPNESLKTPADGVASAPPRTNHRSTEVESSLGVNHHRADYDDVKSEDASTPLTGLTSRHSVPSDATTCVVNGTSDGVDGKEDGEINLANVHELPVQPVKNRPEVSVGRDGGGSVQAAGDEGFVTNITVILVLPVKLLERHDDPSHVSYFSDPSMTFGHLQRDTNLQSNVSVGYSLNQALGSHLTPTLSSRTAFHDGYRLSDSPPSVIDPTGATQRSGQAPAGPSHSPIHEFSIPLQGDNQAANALKRKQADGIANITNGLSKRRREGEEIMDAFDTDSHGSKHWTEEEKSKLFNWLMGPGEDDHWNALRATKNSCLREARCAVEVFGGKKSYQALKGCYERNFNLFKQIYAFEAFNVQQGAGPVTSVNEGERLREYERRLQVARKGGCDVGNVNARTIDHWHRSGWYSLFYRRWHGDPATTRPINRNPNAIGTSSVGGGGDEGEDDEPIPDYQDPNPTTITQSRTPTYSFRSQSVPEYVLPEAGPSNAGSRISTVVSSPSNDQSLVNFTVPQNMMAACLQLLQSQSHHSKMKLDYLRRREEREEKDTAARRELDRTRQEREAAEWEHTKQTANVKHRAQLATELLGNPTVDASVRQAAGDYLKKLFAD
ncbi:hypothetical protein BV22DRAFT_1011093 [Leucogyrophana mollusca]|uniref:Uncharacterized protein n=1 Tax=Leucogyrophana mollusca TaxID=85980 RepID=A0ACB8BJR8_9AGAM|nr:hypothetical protein BV22DRAFT_1011093 [Leucogyrophana mollusca]